MERPTPEAMLARVEAEAERQTRGRLTVFFGAAPGVGKTCAMLDAGHQAVRDGVDVVLGWVETHGRAATEARTVGLERLPPRVVLHRNMPLAEFDLDAALARRPTLLLVDELPHRNAAGCRHTNRWQDVEELLSAGIDVYTTLNVQHLESLNDVIAQITGVTVRETVPDALIEKADAVHLVDLSADDLLRRLREGHIYKQDAINPALNGFFQKKNLTALRELALRRTAERVDADVLDQRRAAGVAATWAAGERLMVAVGPAPQAADLVRAAARIAGRLHAPWLAVSVETGPLANDARERIAGHLALAERLGAEVQIARAESAVEALLEIARKRNVTRILVGRPTHPRWRDRLYGSFVDELVRGADGVDVVITSGERGETTSPAVAMRWPAAREFAEASLWVGTATVIGVVALEWLTLADEAMLLLAAVVIAASRLSRGASVYAAALSVVLLDLFFVPPYYTFAVADARYFITFTVMFAVGLFVGDLTQRVRAQAAAARQREARTAALYAATRAFAAATEPAAIALAATRQARDMFEVPATVVRSVNGELVAAGEPLSPRDEAVARWVLANGRPAGFGTATLPGTDRLFVPLLGSHHVVGALGLGIGQGAPLAPSQRELLDVYATNIAGALERAELAERHETARLVLETERTRTSLLSAVSHDLRTPLASITGAASAMLQGGTLSPEDHRALLETIRDEGDRLGKLIAGLLDLVRLDGTPTAQKEWVPLEEVVLSAVNRLQEQVGPVEVNVDLPEGLALVPMDPVLIDQLLFHLLDNAVKHGGGPIAVEAFVSPTLATVSVLDRGPGLPAGAEAKVFERFWQAEDGRRQGTGLGLAIAAAISRVHGATLTASNRDGGGARFMLQLPIEGTPPAEAL